MSNDPIRHPDLARSLSSCPRVRRRALFHRSHPHAVGGARRVPEECPRVRMRSARSRSMRATPPPSRRSRPARICWCCIGWTRRAATSSCRRRATHDTQRGTFALRSPVRPNPIAASVVQLKRVDGTRLSVVGLDCLDGTPLIDIKPYFASTDAAPAATVGWHTTRKAT